MTIFQKKLLVLGIFLILFGIILGAFGAHGLEGKISTDKIASFETGVRYQFYHGFSFIILGLILPYLNFSLTWIMRLMLVGVFLFSGSIYLLATQSIFDFNLSKILGPMTPIGGLFLILSWSLLLIQLLRQKIN